ncbi:MAG: hypothetical protein ACOYNM_19580, partial [Gemmataceae bacterium]
ITPSSRTKTKPVHNPNLCSSAFCPWKKPLFLIDCESKWKIVSYSVEPHRHLSTVRDQPLDLSEWYANQVASYSCRAMPHAFANQVV